MGSRLLGQSTNIYTGMELTKYVNNANGSEYANIAEAVLGAGTAVVGLAVFPPVAAGIAATLGLAMAADAVISTIEAALDDHDLGSTIERMVEGDSLKIVTKFYEWSSGSGNSYTWYCTEVFSIV